MKRETYKGRKLQTTKGTDYGYSRAKINGVDLGRHLGNEDAAMAWMKGQIDFIDQEDINGDRWAAEWYAPGTFELCENNHPKTIGGECLHSYCTARRPAPIAETIAPELPAGTRVTTSVDKYAGQVGTVQEDNRGTVTNTEHENYGRAFVSVKWDPTPETPWGQGNRPFVDELTVVDAGRLSLEEALEYADQMRRDTTVVGLPNWPEHPEAAAPYRAEYPVAGTSCTLVITDDEVQGHCADHGHLTTVKTSAYAFPGVHVERVARLHHNEEHDQD